MYRSLQHCTTRRREFVSITFFHQSIGSYIFGKIPFNNNKLLLIMQNRRGIHEKNENCANCYGQRDTLYTWAGLPIYEAGTRWYSR